MPTKEGQELVNGPLFIEDENGKLVPIAPHITKIGEITDLESQVNEVAEWIIAMDFRYTAKKDRIFNRKIRKEVNRKKRLIRNIRRKKEKSRRMALKYGTADSKTQHAMLTYELAIFDLAIWREEAKHGYSRVPERRR